MWSANEFFYGSEQGSRPDVYDVDAPPRGPYHLPSPVAYSSGHPEVLDHHQRYDSPPYIRPRSAPPHGYLARSRTPPYAGASPLVDYQPDHQPASTLHPSPYQPAPYAAPRELHGPVGPYVEHGNAYAAPVPATYYDASHVQLPHSGAYTGSYYGDTSLSASAAPANLQKSVELRVPLCCEACGERIRNALFVLEGVRAVALDFERHKVTIVGDVNTAKALELVTAIAPGDATHLRVVGTQNVMYRNM